VYNRINNKQEVKEKKMSQGVIHDYEPSFKTFPKHGWKDGYFYLISHKGSMKRIYKASDDDLPAWAMKMPGSSVPPAEQQPQTNILERTRDHEFVEGSFLRFCKICGAPRNKHA
jgi:hypothetical protein